MSDELPAPAAPPTPPAPAPSDARRLRVRALWTGLGLIPATFLVVVLALASESGTRCVMQGTCGDVPGWLTVLSLAVAAAAWITALCTPSGAPPAPVRTAAFWIMVGAEATFLTLVLAHFTGGAPAG
ncbi:hypothetical protein ABZ135_08080 [Streptomyces sp. NPDC006339]|uniref:hypothetical protein n=1 Tax=Streptomyces sp. NPDC006339 TaxID=3156755 RepID=UPI0033BBA591